MSYKFHRNLSTGAWTITPRGERTQPCAAATLHGVTFRHPSTNNKQFNRCLAGGPRKVFAWVTCAAVVPGVVTELPPGGERVYFNPREGDREFHVWRNGVRLTATTADKVIALPGGEFIAWGVRS